MTIDPTLATEIRIITPDGHHGTTIPAEGLMTPTGYLVSVTFDERGITPSGGADYPLADLAPEGA